jgi:hypothetical protein
MHVCYADTRIRHLAAGSIIGRSQSSIRGAFTGQENERDTMVVSVTVGLMLTAQHRGTLSRMLPGQGPRMLPLNLSATESCRSFAGMENICTDCSSRAEFARYAVMSQGPYQCDRLVLAMEISRGPFDLSK